MIDRKIRSTIGEITMSDDEMEEMKKRDGSMEKCNPWDECKEKWKRKYNSGTMGNPSLPPKPTKLTIP